MSIDVHAHFWTHAYLDKIAAAVAAAELTASGTPSRVAHSAHCRDSTVARSDSSTQAAFRHGTKFPIW